MQTLWRAQQSRRRPRDEDDEEQAKRQKLEASRRAPNRRYKVAGRAPILEREDDDRSITTLSLQTWPFTHVVGINRAPFMYAERPPTVLLVDARSDEGYWETPIDRVPVKAIYDGLWAAIRDVYAARPDLDLQRLCGHLMRLPHHRAKEQKEDEAHSATQPSSQPLPLAGTDLARFAHEAASAAAAAAAPPPPSPLIIRRSNEQPSASRLLRGSSSAMLQLTPELAPTQPSEYFATPPLMMRPPSLSSFHSFIP
jgi:hypothetical protein